MVDPLESAKCILDNHLIIQRTTIVVFDIVCVNKCSEIDQIVKICR